MDQGSRQRSILLCVSAAAATLSKMYGTYGYVRAQGCAALFKIILANIIQTPISQ